MCTRVILRVTVALAVCATSASPARADIDTGLVAYWPLDADAVDATGDGSTGTIKGAVTRTVDRFGHRDSAMHFSGEPNSYINLWSPWVLPRHAMTVAAWVRADALPHAGEIVTMRDGHFDTQSCSLQLASGGIARFEIMYPGMIPEPGMMPDMPAGTDADSEPLAFGPAQWFHMVGVFRSGEAVELWINGRPAASRPVALMSHFTDGSGSVRIGGPDPSWAGDIDEVRLYARALSPADVNELYAFAPSPHLKAWAPQPPDGAVGVTDESLTWKRGATSASWNLYFGTTPLLGPKDLLVGDLPCVKWTDRPHLDPGATYYWRVDEIEADGKTIYTGDVWRFTTEPYMAFDPWPAEGATSVSCEMNLSWSAGPQAWSHEVYFGTDVAAVTARSGDVFKGRQTGTRFEPGPLQMGMTYYWRVDGIGPANILGQAQTFVGPLWRFMTADLPVIDDFERYDGHNVESDGDEHPYVPLNNTWFDSWGYGRVPPICDPGPCPPEPPFAERTIVHAGRQSMVFDFNNAVEPPYSEIERRFDLPQNWTVNGADTLVLYVRGVATNDPEPFYIAIQDTAGRVFVATHPDPQVLLATTWVEWKIPLQSIAGVKLNWVKMVYLGVGNRSNPKPGGLGWVFVDDIRVIKATPGP